MLRVSRMSLRCKKKYFLQATIITSCVLKFQSRLYACTLLFSIWSEFIKHNAENELHWQRSEWSEWERERERKSRNALRNENILWMCCHHIFQYKIRFIAVGVPCLCSSSSLFFPNIIMPLTWFRNFFFARYPSVFTYEQFWRRRNEDCRRVRLTPFSPRDWLVSKSKIDIYLQFPCQNMNSKFFSCSFVAAT